MTSAWQSQLDLLMSAASMQLQTINWDLLPSTTMSAMSREIEEITQRDAGSLTIAFRDRILLSRYALRTGVCWLMHIMVERLFNTLELDAELFTYGPYCSKLDAVLLTMFGRLDVCYYHIKNPNSPFSWLQLDASAHAQVVQACDVAISGLSAHGRGDVATFLYEQVLEALSDPKKFGQFYTPRPFAEFMLRRIGVSADTAHVNNVFAGGAGVVQSLYDPACGNGSFIAPYFRCVVAHAASNEAVWQNPDLLFRLTLSLFNQVWGTDIDRFACNACQLNMLVQMMPMFQQLSALRATFPDWKVPEHIPAINIVHMNPLALRNLTSSVTSAEGGSWSTRCFLDGLDKATELLQRQFQYVIGNPPYIRKEMVSQAFLNVDTDLKLLGKRSDLQDYFILRGLQLCVAGGVLCFVTPSAWLVARTAGTLRSTVLLGKYWLREFFDCGRQIVFPKLSVDSLVFVIENSPPGNQLVSYYEINTDGMNSLRRATSPLTTLISLFDRCSAADEQRWVLAQSLRETTASGAMGASEELQSTPASAPSENSELSCITVHVTAQQLLHDSFATLKVGQQHTPGHELSSSRAAYALAHLMQHRVVAMTDFFKTEHTLSTWFTVHYGVKTGANHKFVWPRYRVAQLFGSTPLVDSAFKALINPKDVEPYIVRPRYDEMLCIANKQTIETLRRFAPQVIRELHRLSALGTGATPASAPPLVPFVQPPPPVLFPSSWVSPKTLIHVETASRQAVAEHVDTGVCMPLGQVLDELPVDDVMDSGTVETLNHSASAGVMTANGATTASASTITADAGPERQAKRAKVEFVWNAELAGVVPQHHAEGGGDVSHLQVSTLPNPPPDFARMGVKLITNETGTPSSRCLRMNRFAVDWNGSAVLNRNLMVVPRLPHMNEAENLNPVWKNPLQKLLSGYQFYTDDNPLLGIPFFVGLLNSIPLEYYARRLGGASETRTNDLYRYYPKRVGAFPVIVPSGRDELIYLQRTVLNMLAVQEAFLVMETEQYELAPNLLRVVNSHETLAGLRLKDLKDSVQKPQADEQLARLYQASLLYQFQIDQFMFSLFGIPLEEQLRIERDVNLEPPVTVAEFFDGTVPRSPIHRGLGCIPDWAAQIPNIVNVVQSPLRELYMAKIGSQLPEAAKLG
eukprot:TRINITY_DN7491_c0_g1_i1.p1 TRINITY_DN7491_c0_g1~~TRINITY_DN7491_c0_g1_i1.p1  ORF type:complete len:1143 (+),score=226.38 TRINITY_DN7491_c0_g1_i1:42-3470(+)